MEGTWAHRHSLFYVLFPVGLVRNDPDWLPQVPELRDDFAELRRGFRQWNFRAIPIMVVMWVFFGLLFNSLQHP